MKILFLQDELDRGGAARAAIRLGEVLATRGHEIIFFTGWSLPSIAKSDVRTSLPPRWKRFFMRQAGKNLAFRLHGLEVRRCLRACLAQFRPALILIHNLDRGPGWGPRLLETCAAGAPTLWVLHDMYSLGLGSHYFSPKECPIQGGQFWKTQRLAHAIAQGRLAAVAPSRWLAGLATQTVWSGGRVEHIPNPLDLGADPLPWKAHPADSFCLISSDFNDPRKFPVGASLLLKRLIARGGRLHLAGRNPPDMPGLQRHGFIEDEVRMQAFFREATINLHPSLLDNLPNTVAEAALSGLPSLTMDRLGGTTELIPEEWKSWSRLPDQPEQAAETAMQRVREAAARPEIGKSFERHVRSLTRPDTVADRYENLFRSLLRNADQ